MNKRGVIITSTLLGLFALFFGVLGVRALTLGPDPARPTATELAARTTAANTLERQIGAAKADVPPALPEIPARVPMPASPSGGAAPAANAARAAAPAPAVREYEDDDEYEEEEDDEYEEEDDDHGEYEDDHEEGDDDDD